MVAALPLEIYGLVAEHVSLGQDLVNLSCVSSAIRTEVERVLYRMIHVSTQEYQSPIIDSLLNRLSTTPRLASAVQKFHLEYHNRAPSETILAAALRALNNLVHLHITAQNVQIYQLTQGCTFRLRRFEYWDGESQVATSLGDFLARQPLIRHLAIKVFQAHEDLPADLLPHLDTLECPAYLGKALVISRRPIKRLLWRSGRMYFTEPIYGPYPTLLVLVLGTKPYGYNLATQCPNLRLLECSLSDNLIAELPSLEKNIKGLRHLHTLRDGAESPWNTIPDAANVADEVTRALMGVMKTLQLVQIGLFQKRRDGKVETKDPKLQPWYAWIEGL